MTFVSSRIDSNQSQHGEKSFTARLNCLYIASKKNHEKINFDTWGFVPVYAVICPGKRRKNHQT
jgi:hypothetical protein